MQLHEDVEKKSLIFYDGYKRALKELILEYTKNKLEGKGYDFYFAINDKLDKQLKKEKDER